ncbi:NOP protein chaperone 1-like [Ylistrum balloti]|uniref:NOP protein chaperone 1-like n=1 Tax=Ylistrum balloti TaxID=509963 RepID=UPI002905EB9C|nr:NOP protein chaperone 1-like [Ylistrum balloti]
MEGVMNDSMQHDAKELEPSNTTKQRFTKSKDLLNISEDDGIADRLLVNKRSKASKLAGPRKTFKPPASSVLSEVKSFLPKMAKANEDLTALLTKVPASMVDIENVSDDTPNVIEMNISLVPDMGSDSNNSDCDSESSDIDFGEVTEENFKIVKTNGQVRNGIVELNPSSDEDEDKNEKT